MTVAGDEELKEVYCPMVPEHKKSWVEGLRSGNYKQGRGHLRQSNGEDVFCCLGVLQDIVHPDDWVEPNVFGSDDAKLWQVPEVDMYDDADDPSLSDGEIQEKLMDATNFDSEAMHILITMNDGEYPSGGMGQPKVNMKTFEQIADAIEGQL